MPYDAYEWAGTMYSIARTYEQYLENRKSRQRYLILLKQMKEGRVKRTGDKNGYFYSDFKLKHRFYIENLLLSDNGGQYFPNPEPTPQQHTEITNLKGYKEEDWTEEQ